MRIIKSLAELPDAARGAVLAIGNFDGVHAGHQAVIGAAARIAGRAGAPVGAMTFEPHPRSFFAPEKPLFRLTPEPVKLALLARIGLDLVVVLPFDAALARLSADEFVDEVLLRRLAVRHVVTGYDFHFGRDRTGTPDFLAEKAMAGGFDVTTVEAYAGAGETPVSSSAIRAHLSAGEVEAAAGKLGYRWFVQGEVIHGEKRGRDLGYPTANMRLEEQVGLAHGIYAVRMRVGGTVREGVASFGRRPQFDNGAPLLETFLFDFSGDLYGRMAEVEFVRFLRAEARFESVEALVAQMDRDGAQAREVLSAIRTEPFGPDALAPLTGALP
jgi:riboflavin kinase/FMN adenylyltransferase